VFFEFLAYFIYQKGKWRQLLVHLSQPVFGGFEIEAAKRLMRFGTCGELGHVYTLSHFCDCFCFSTSTTLFLFQNTRLQGKLLEGLEHSTWFGIVNTAESTGSIHNILARALANQSEITNSGASSPKFRCEKKNKKIHK
jgi:hypothetical protein